MALPLSLRIRAVPPFLVQLFICLIALWAWQGPSWQGLADCRAPTWHSKSSCQHFSLQWIENQSQSVWLQWGIMHRSNLVCTNFQLSTIDPSSMCKMVTDYSKCATLACFISLHHLFFLEQANLTCSGSHMYNEWWCQDSRKYLLFSLV